MINITNKTNCCGCSACVQSCPKHCIVMQEDNEGFLYPQVDVISCIDCHMCEKVCPCINKNEPHEPLLCYAAKNFDENTRKQSSSGGVFSVLVDQVFREDGVVIGAGFDEAWTVVHQCFEKTDDYSLLRGSKYVQSRLSSIFKQAEEFLKSGREVLFSGTPCQIAGLKSYLKKNYESLITVEVACHGVPSPLFFKDYLAYVSNNKIESISDISFRNKRKGWLKYRFIIKAMINGKSKTLLDEARANNFYMQSFLKNYNLRPSCYGCSFKAGCSTADITLADFWGVWHIAPELFDENGVSVVLINSQKGKSFWDRLYIIKDLVNYADIIKFNSSLVNSSIEPSDRDLFWKYWRERNYIKLRQILLSPKKSIINRLLKRLIKW